MNRFQWGETTADHGENHVTSQTGIALYDGNDKTNFVGGVLCLTSHRLMWKENYGKSTAICLSLSLVKSLDEQPSGFAKSAKIVVYLQEPLAGQPSGPAASSKYNYVRLSFRDSGESEDLDNLFQDFGINADGASYTPVEEFPIEEQGWGVEAIEGREEYLIATRVESFCEAAQSDIDSDTETQGPTENTVDLPTQCTCKTACIFQFDKQTIEEHRLSIQEMIKSEKEMFIIGCLNPISDATTRLGKRQRSRFRFCFNGKQVCKKTFMFINDIGIKALRHILEHINENGFVPRVHGNAGRKPHHALQFNDVKRSVDWLLWYADIYGLPMPAAPRGEDGTAPVLLPSNLSKVHLHREYLRFCEHSSVRSIGISSFKGIWKACVPHIRIMSPREDVCPKCELLRKKVADAGTDAEKLASATALSNHVQFLRYLKQVLQEKKWEDKVLPPSRPGVQGGRHRPGIVGIERSIQQKQKQTDSSINQSFQDLKQLMDKAQEMVFLSKKIVSKIKDTHGEITEDETVKFKAYLLSMGIPNPVTRETHGTGDNYYKELARELASVLEKPIKESGGMMTVTDVYCRVNRARGMELLSPEDLLNACDLFEMLKLPVRLRTFESGVKVLQSSNHSEQEVIKKTASVVEENGSLTADELAQLIGLSVILSKERLLLTEKVGGVCRDDSEEGLRFYPNWFLTKT